MSLRVHLRGSGATGGLHPTGIKRYVRGVLRGEGRREGAITVVLTDDAGIRALNARFRDQDRVTDVLAFPYSQDGIEVEPGEPGEGPYLGDVVVSLERARTQAPRFHNDPEAELARLLAHGVLHLCGHDHHHPADGRRMKAAERRALAGFEPGTLWGEPWAAGGAAGPTAV